MNPHDVLVADHDVLRGLLDDLVRTTPAGAARRRELLARLLEVLTIHAQIEDQLYYLRIRDVTPLFPVAHAEHRQLDDQLAVLLRTDPSSDDFKVEAQMLASILGHHADEEEEEMFPQVQDRLDGATLDRLGRELSAFHARLHRSPVTRTRIRLKGEVLRRLP